jgi:hypothetical protein
MRRSILIGGVILLILIIFMRFVYLDQWRSGDSGVCILFKSNPTFAGTFYHERTWEEFAFKHPIIALRERVVIFLPVILFKWLGLGLAALVLWRSGRAFFEQLRRPPL